MDKQDRLHTDKWTDRGADWHRQAQAGIQTGDRQTANQTLTLKGEGVSDW